MIDLELKDTYYDWMELTVELNGITVSYDVGKSELKYFIEQLEEMLETAKDKK